MSTTETIKDHESELKLMGLSDIPRLQQKHFFSALYGNYILKVIGNQVVIYNEISYKSKEQEVTDKEKQNLSKEKFNGQLSRKSQTRIKKIVQAWDDTIEHYNVESKLNKSYKYKKLNLITLTLSKKQNLDDRYIKRYLLNYFLTTLLRSYPDMKYLWKAEPQANDNIHFHILIDKYIPKKWVQKIWNEIQQMYQLHETQKITQKNPGQPSTRIETLKNKKNATAYVSKYITKNEGKRKIEGRLWGCSSELKKIKEISYIMSKEEIQFCLNQLITKKSKFIIDDYFMTIFNASNIKILKDSFITDERIQNTLNQNIEALYKESKNIQKEVTQSINYNPEILNEAIKIKQTINYNKCPGPYIID